MVAKHSITVKMEVLEAAGAALGPSVDDDFYMATFRGGKVLKVINMLGGPPRRVRRVLDFNTDVEIEKEEALARKRKELGSGSELEVPSGKKEKTLAEVLLEMKKRKIAGAVATVQRQKPIPAKKANSRKKAVPVKNVSPVKEVAPMEEVSPVEEVAPMEEVSPMEEVAPMEEVSPAEEVAPMEEVSPAEEVAPMEEVSPVEEVAPIEEVSPVEEVDSIEEVVPTEELASRDEEIHTEKVDCIEETVPVEEVAPVEEVVPVEASPPRKKRKRRSTSLLHTSSEPLDPPSEPQGDDETLADYLKKSASTTARASSDNAGIKVFQRRKVKFKAVRRRTSFTVGNGSPKSGDKQSSSILVCDDLCECEECGPLDRVAPTTVEYPMTRSRVLASCSTSTVSDDVPDCGTLEGLSTDGTEQLAHPDACMGEFETLTLPDDPQLPGLHHNVPIDDTDDIEERTEEQFRVEVAQQVPSEVAALGSGFFGSASPVSHCPENLHVGKRDEYVDASNDGPEPCDSDMPEVIDAKSRPQLPEETSGIEGDADQGPCAFNTESSNSFSFASPWNLNGNADLVAENAVSVVTPMELDLAAERIESILETLVTPDELLPADLSASVRSVSKSTRKKKKRRRFSDSVSLDMVTKEGSYLGGLSLDSPRVPQMQEESLAEPTSLDELPSLADNVPSSVSDVMECHQVALTATSESSGILAHQISEQISEQISGQISELVWQEQGLGLEPTLGLLSEEKDKLAACSMDVEVVPPSPQEDTVVNAEEFSSNGTSSLVPPSDAVEVVGTPTKSPSCNEASEVCQTPSTHLDAAEREEGVAGGTSSSKALFSNLKTDGFSKRNRKSFSPKSQKALLEASRQERSTPPFKIKLMRTNLSDRCSSILFSQKMVQSKPSHQDQDSTPDNSSGQDVLQCDVEQIQLVDSLDQCPLSPPSQTPDGTPNMSAPFPSGTPSDCNTDVVPGSPEYKKEPYVSPQSVTDPVSICTPVNAVSNLPCTEGSLHIDVGCHPGTPIDPTTPNERIEPESQQPKSILKTRSDTCRGICECPRCVSTCNVSTTARNFIRSQMRMADDVARKLLDEIRNIRTLVEDASASHAEGDAATLASNIPSEKAKGALESATKAEDWATRELLKMSRDSKRVCRLIEVGPRRTIFADDAGHRLCHVKLLPGKKPLSKESLLPTKSL